MKVVDNFNKYLSDILPGFRPFDFKDKDRARSNYIRYMLNRTQSMFKWEGLPETIPARILELYLQTNGNACFYKHEGNLYVFIGGRGGTPDVYYMPTIYTIANPALKLDVQANIDINCVVMPNDSMYMGLMPMFERYATSMCEIDLSLDIATVNARIIDLISATDDRTRASAIEFLDNVRDGELGVISSNEFLDGLRTAPYGATGHQTITDLIELMQYNKASWFNELGLNANYNMKRESLNSSESQLNNDALLPLVDDMLKCRQTFAEKVNEMFGTDISVSLNSSWEDNEQELLLEQGQGLTEDQTTPEEVPEITEEPETVEDQTEPEEVSEITEEQTTSEEPETVEDQTESEEVPETIPVEVVVNTTVDIIPTEPETATEEEPETEEKETEDNEDDKETE